MPSSRHTSKLNNVIFVLHLLHNLVSISKFTHDNFCSFEFEAFGFSVKDQKTRHVLLRCNSNEDLCIFPDTTCTSWATSTMLAMIATSTAELWHERLGHPIHDTMSVLQHLYFVKLNKIRRTSVCHACQLGKHVRLPFSSSNSASSTACDLIYYDLWASPIISASGFGYYLAIFDDYSHFL
jgi:hypothetical protein